MKDNQVLNLSTILSHSSAIQQSVNYHFQMHFRKSRACSQYFFFQLFSLVRICLNQEFLVISVCLMAYSSKNSLISQFQENQLIIYLQMIRSTAIHFILFLNQSNAFLLLIIKILKNTNAQFFCFSNTSQNIDSIHFFVTVLYLCIQLICP